MITKSTIVFPKIKLGVPSNLATKMNFPITPSLVVDTEVSVLL